MFPIFATVTSMLLPIVFASTPPSDTSPSSAQIKLHIPRYTEFLSASDPNDHHRGDYDVFFNFTKEDLNNHKRYEFVWTTLEHVDTPETLLMTPYWNMTCFASASEPFKDAAAFTLMEKKPWIKVDHAKPWAGISCIAPKCLATACRAQATPVIDTVSI
ncbi:uncharacterized protein IL334_005524 [Kwoniella shivajii]|uniref:Uncharacterized protein n=1 Tax=Kwoniella shivajii TaxID=564305 RepID=A0ABZ1D7C6_9TREE|nr:hypothetical protein IL334_005524 [Kwoniella shivajii]